MIDNLVCLCEVDREKIYIEYMWCGVIVIVKRTACVAGKSTLRGTNRVIGYPESTKASISIVIRMQKGNQR